MTGIEGSRRWLALILLCMGELMIVLDTTIVNVALPSIKADLGFSETSLVWVVNAYMLTFSGFLLLGGRLGDLYGPRRLFVSGIAAFTLASLVCGLAISQEMLIAARAIQGLGGAVVSAVALSLIMRLFTEEGERARAMGIIGFIAAGGGAIGVLLGGLLTGALNWHWVFLINIPIGIAVYALCMYLLPKDAPQDSDVRLDVPGAAAVTASLMLAVYGIVNGGNAGWLSAQTVFCIGASIALMGLFLWIESRVKDPLMPLTLFKIRSVAVANIVGILWSVAMFAWFFIAALYLQLILGFTPLQVGLAFLPANLIMAAFSLGLSAIIVTKYGYRWPLAFGMALVASGLGVFSFASLDGTFAFPILPAMILLGVGAGLAFNPVLLAAMSDVPQDETGLASGVVNTAFMMGGSVGLAVLASLAASVSAALIAAGVNEIAALNAGYQTAFTVGSIFAALAAITAAVFLRENRNKPLSEMAH